MDIKKWRGREVCNICGLPGIVTYRQVDQDTGKMEIKTVECDCLGHHGLHPSLLNLHPYYGKYKRLRERQLAISQRGKQ